MGERERQSGGSSVRCRRVPGPRLMCWALSETTGFPYLLTEPPGGILNPRCPTPSAAALAPSHLLRPIWTLMHCLLTVSLPDSAPPSLLFSIRQYELVVHTDIDMAKVYEGEMGRLKSYQNQKP